MTSLIQQTIAFDGVTAARLYDTYVDAKNHSAAVGAPARISGAVGADFAIFGEDKVRGKTIALVPGQLIVQSWRGTVWRDADPDSLLVLAFTDGSIQLTQAGVPRHAHEVIADGWHRMYWTPWREHFGLGR